MSSREITSLTVYRVWTVEETIRRIPPARAIRMRKPSAMFRVRFQSWWTSGTRSKCGVSVSIPWIALRAASRALRATDSSQSLIAWATWPGRSQGAAATKVIRR